MNDSLPKPALLVPPSDEMLEQASLAASEVTQEMLAQKLELEDKKRSVSMLQKALVIVTASLRIICLHCHTTLCLKKVLTFELSTTLSNLNGFSKYVHCCSRNIRFTVISTVTLPR